MNWPCVESPCNGQVNYSEEIVTLVSQADLEGGRLHIDENGHQCLRKRSES